MASKLDERWFTQRFHYRFQFQANQAGSCWHVTIANGRKLVPDVADRLTTQGGGRIESDQAEQWLFPSTFSRQELEALLEQACHDAEDEREQLAVLLETRQLAAFETVVLPSAYPDQWIVALHAPTSSGIRIPIRLPKPEQRDQVHPTFQNRPDAEAYASFLKQTYGAEEKRSNCYGAN
jgi:hypothetical protein